MPEDHCFFLGLQGGKGGRGLGGMWNRHKGLGTVMVGLDFPPWLPHRGEVHLKP